LRRILVTGALGQIGSELVPALRERYGSDLVVASDIRTPAPDSPLGHTGAFEVLDCTDGTAVSAAVTRHRVGTIYHLAAVLSAVGEREPHRAWAVNLGGLYAVLEAARDARGAVFVPSSIAAFGPSTPHERTPQDTIQRPTTMYGVTKVAGELLCDYYYRRFGVDTRGVRYPGLISYVAPPGGGTTDYAVDIFHRAIADGRYTCFLSGDTRLDMMYMPDALRAAMEVMEADAARLQHRNAFNLAAMNFTPEEIAAEIRRHVPDFVMEYRVDPVRQSIADSWPRSVDDRIARAEWGWSARYDLPAMTTDMLAQLTARR
jgi:nucleoside-diphosphate-sugar epimerase